MNNRAIVTILVYIAFWGYGNISIAQISADYKSYTIQSEDNTLSDIAEKLGSEDFWQPIYRANSDIISNNGFIEEGQVLTLPAAVFQSKEFIYHSSNKGNTSTNPTDKESKEKQLEQFRSAFKSLVNKEKQNQEQSETSPQQDPTLELGGFVLDETRSKMGRDFYNLFYQHWEAPQNASNFTITISEQPTIGRGSQVTIKLDYNQIFSARLQPRYEYIETLSKQAVARSQQAVQQQASVKNQLIGY
ncbi:CsgE family curli-type amyloid fiber assembly protein [Fodinibius salsisoli]|uniref:Curli production assembly/transport component CsgE n=1 Tax=Fodinibius salsisoli TaxID=2820877 RepID=A0ABT3PMJ1_9BACT|nr:CsgE family curli-type amyloid fiber assembly protein [Fodinibius salsisoli]MCW9707166.1 LysM peptidoglycan-binding domain-containing protein [Fodinibius salsisoli]